MTRGVQVVHGLVNKHWSMQTHLFQHPGFKPNLLIDTITINTEKHVQLHTKSSFTVEKHLTGENSVNDSAATKVK
jgi:hypothetical protein